LQRLIIAITGASGAIYGVRALELLRDAPDIETHLILSPSAKLTIAAELDITADAVKAMADVAHPYKDIGASLSSGSFRTAGMLIAPCSIKTLSGIANSYNDNLIVRTADVCLKERRRVVLLLRETPLHRGHLDLAIRATDNGAVIMPPVPAFYHRPAGIDDIVNQTIGRALDLFDIDAGIVSRWAGMGGASADGNAK
jgi:4-hydroxy-3-polyprenylbenzoate decarboxylase